MDGNERNIRNHSDGAVLQSRKSEIRKCDDDSWRRQQAIAHSDGYEAYHKDICLMVVGCMSHVRRKFVETQKASVGEKEIRKLSTREERIEYLDSHPGYKNILIAIHYINKLFKIEETLKKEGATPTERYKRRQEESLPIFNEFFVYLHEIEG